MYYMGVPATDILMEKHYIIYNSYSKIKYARYYLDSDFQAYVS